MKGKFLQKNGIRQALGKAASFINKNKKKKEFNCHLCNIKEEHDHTIIDDF